MFAAINARFLVGRAHLAANCNTNQQIARLLQLSDRTVETHVRNICTKLEVSSRTAIAIAAARQDTGP